MIHRYAKQIIGAVSADGQAETASPATPNPFKIPNTFEARAMIGPVQDRIRCQSIAIIGLGGTGAYVLDLVAKTPVQEIHTLDNDYVEWHNFMRAPGAPTAEEIDSVKGDTCARWTTTILSTHPSGKASTHTRSEWTARPRSVSFCWSTPSTLPSCVSTS